MNLINTYTNIGNSDIDNMQLTTDYQRRGYHQVTLTEMDTTTVPKVAEGSMVEVGGALYEAQSDETISGSASTGTNYIKLVPGTGVVTPTWTTTAPTWSDAKQGWYGTGGSASHKYALSLEYDGASAYTKKDYLSKPLNSDKKPIVFDDAESFTHIRAECTTGNLSGSGTMPFATEDFDNNGDFNNSTYVFTAPVDGFYLIHGNIKIRTTNTSYYLQSDFVFTGPTTGFQLLSRVQSTGTSYDTGYSFNANMSQGDTLQVNYIAVSGNVEIRAYTYLCIDRLF